MGITAGTALMIGSTLASGAATAYSQKQQSEAVVESAENRQEQERKAAEMKAFERSRQARRERARMQAGASVAGVEGQSVGLQLADSRFQESHDRSYIRENRNMAMEANKSRAAAKNAQIGDPNMTLVQTGLNIGTSYANDPNTFQGGTSTTGSNFNQQRAPRHYQGS